MKTNIITIFLAGACVAAVAQPKFTITLGDAKDGHEVSAMQWGVFFEDINWSADGGLNPEQLANAGFDWAQADHDKWNCTEDGWEGDFREGGMARLSFQYGAPVHPNTAKHLRIEAFGTGRAGVRNRGYDGIFLKEGAEYRLSFDWRELRKEGMDYALGAWKRESRDFKVQGPDFKAEYPGFEVLIEKDAAAKDARSTLSIFVKGRRVVEFDNVSLVPTSPDLVRAGLRKDLVDKLADLKPSFVRFPGGCIVESGDFQHWYDWRRTVGPKERRECVQNRWAAPKKPYWETFGVGYYEYFRLCEEIGAEPLPVCLSGLTCQYQRPAQMCAVEDADYFAEVILELIEFANGGVDTVWGRVRAEMGHPEPFNLKMVGVGNENWDAVFFDRCERIGRIIREKHPEITIIGSSGPDSGDKRFRYAWERVTLETADIVDEHYYATPEWFLGAAHRYDGYAREGKPKVYAGEYACHDRPKGKPNSMWSAVCEAAAMTGFERNGDVVAMASYAPLFARYGHDQWRPNLVWFDGTKSVSTPNYYVQQLFSLNRPTRTIPCTDNLASDEQGFFYSAGFDEKTGDKILKFVNAAGSAFEVAVEGAAGKATLSVLAAEKEAVNRIGEEPARTETRAVEFGGVISLPPYSVSVLRIEG